MSSTPDYLKPYEFALRIHGPDFRTTLWNNRTSQRIRFQVMAEICPLAGRRVLDAGCGMGDFLEYLEQAGQQPSAYVGLDALADLIAEAGKRQFKTPARFIAADVVADPSVLATDQPEVIVISGTLNTLDAGPFYATLDAAYAAAGECLAFNFLSTCHDSRFAAEDGVIRRYDPVAVFAHGLQLTRHVIVRHDYYEGHDCTMAWLKIAK